MTNNENFWWAENTRNGKQHPWVPTLQTDNACFSLPIWFATEAECEAFIDQEIVGADRDHKD